MNYKGFRKKLERDSPALECSVYENDTKKLLMIGYIRAHQDYIEKLKENAPKNNKQTKKQVLLLYESKLHRKSFSIA